MAAQGTYDFEIIRGNTFGGVTFTLTNTVGGSAIALTSARAQIRERTGDKALLHTFTCTISGGGSNVVTLSNLSAAASAALKPGVHRWDLEVTRADGVVRTYVAGNFTVVEDVSR